MASEQDTKTLPLLPADEQRIATRGDLDAVETRVRREMRYLLVIGVAGGNVLAAAIASYVSAPGAVKQSLAAASRLVGL